MPLEDLDLEFEDEEDLKRKRDKETVHQDVDLEFGVSPTVAAKATAPTSAPKVAAAAPDKTTVIPSPGKPALSRPAPTSPAVNPSAQVRRLDEARAAAAKKPQAANPNATNPGRPMPMVQGANALDLDLPPEEAGLTQLYEEVERTKFEAKVQVAVAEFKTEILSDLLSDVKVLDLQVHQLLVRINQKHPDLKPEVMALKKLLADFAAKKRK